MSQPNKPQWRSLPAGHARPLDIDKLLDTLRTLDRTVVEISMHIYRIPQRERAAMRQRHRRLHDTIRERLPRLLSGSASFARG